MNNEEKILSMLETMVAEQQKTNNRLDKLEQGQKEIKSELRYVWDDIKKLDDKISTHDELLNK